MVLDDPVVQKVNRRSSKQITISMRYTATNDKDDTGIAEACFVFKRKDAQSPWGDIEMHSGTRETGCDCGNAKCRAYPAGLPPLEDA